MVAPNSSSLGVNTNASFVVSALLTSITGFSKENLNYNSISLSELIDVEILKKSLVIRI